MASPSIHGHKHSVRHKLPHKLYLIEFAKRDFYSIFAARWGDIKRMTPSTPLKNILQMNKTLLSFCCAVTALGAGAQIPLDYYAPLYGLTGRDLKQAVHEIVNDDVKMLSYGSGSTKTWWAFYVTDMAEGGLVRDRYSAEEFRFGNRGSSVSGMNIEHSFPKRWWGGSENNAYKDLYHLMPCQTTINNH